MVWQPLVGQGLLLVEAHTQTHTSPGRNPPDEYSARRRHLYLTTHTLDIYAAGWIRIRDLSRRTAEDPGLRPRGHWNRLKSINPLTPNDHYSGRTAPLTSKLCILYIYSTNIGIEYFKHGIYSPFLSIQNAVCFINLTYLVPVLFTFYIQCVLKLKKIIPAPNG